MHYYAITDRVLTMHQQQELEEVQQWLHWKKKEREGFVARGPGMIHGDISDMVDMGSPPGPAASVASSAPRRLNDPLPR